MCRLVAGLLAALLLASHVFAAAVSFTPAYGITNRITAPVQLGHVLGNGVASINITTVADSPAGNAIVVWVASSGSVGNNIGPVTTSAGNTCSSAASALRIAPGVADAVMQPFVCPNALHLVSGGTINILFSPNNCNCFAAAISVPNVAASSPVDVSGSGTTATGTTPSIATGSLPYGADIVVAATYVVNGAFDTFTEASGFTGLTGQVDNTNSGALHWAYQITGSGVTYAPTLGTSRTYGANFTALKSKP